MKRFSFLIPILFIFLNSCGTNLTDLNILSNLNHELTYDDAKKKYYLFLGNIFNKEKEISNVSYQMLRLRIGTDTEKKVNYSSGSKPSTTIVTSTSNFYILFKENKYLFSGFKYQFELYANDKTKEILKEMNRKDDD